MQHYIKPASKLNRRSATIENSGDPSCTTGLLAKYTYDTLSRRSKLTYAANDLMSYTYSLAGDLLSLTNNLNGTGNDNTWTLGYSDAHQLTGEGASNSTYQWQPPATASSTYATANNLNQYPSVTSGTTYPLTYDANGNLASGNIALSGSGAWGFSYDPENRLLNACKPTVSGSCSSPTVNATYAYDPSGRRTHKSGTGVTETFFLNDDSGNEIAEYDSTGALTRRFVPGPSINDPVAMVTGTSSYTHTYYHTDHHGSVAVTARDNGNPMNGPFLYDPSGNCTTATTACTALAATSQPFFFAGMYLDRETGLYYDRARYYWAQAGRFLQTDPVGYTADLNLYTYVGNDPINLTDPTGMDAAAAAAVLYQTGEIDVGEQVIGGGPENPVADAAVVITSIVGLGVAGYELLQPSQNIVHNESADNPAAANDGTKSAPKGNGGNTDTPHGSPEHDAAVNKEVQRMKDQGYRDIRKNQAQVDAEGNKVGNNRPDVQGTNPDTGQREHVEVDRDPNRGAQHERDIMKNDPTAKCTLLSCRK